MTEQFGRQNDPVQENLREDYEYFSKARKLNAEAYESFGRQLEGDKLGRRERLELHSFRLVARVIDLVTATWLKRVESKVDSYAIDLARNLAHLEKEVNDKASAYEVANKNQSPNIGLLLEELNMAQGNLAQFVETKLLYVLNERENPGDRDERLARAVDDQFKF